MGSLPLELNLHTVPVMTVGLLIFGIGLLILIQTKRTIRDIAFFLFCMSSALWLVSMGFIYTAPNAESALRLYKTLTFFGVANLTPNLYLFAAAVSGLLHRQRYWVILTYVVTYGIYFLALTTNYFITTPTQYYWGYYPHYEPANYLFLLTFAIVFFANQAHLKFAFDHEEIPVKQKQIRLVKLSLLFGGTAFIDFIPKIWHVNIYPVGFVSMFILNVFLAYSIIRYKAFDIETVIHKTILWITSFSVILIPIILAYRICFPAIKASGTLQVVFWSISFFVFTVYMRLIQPKIDHLFQRRKSNLEEISGQFARDLVYLEGITNLVKRLEEAIASALYPQWIDIFIYDEKKKEYGVINRGRNAGQGALLAMPQNVAEWMAHNNRIIHRDFFEIDPQFADVKEMLRGYFGTNHAIVSIPLVLNERLLGIINLGKKANLKRYNAVDFQFLTTVKNQSAIAISNSLIYQNIEEQVKERTAELVEVQKQLVQAEKLATVGTLSGGVAHEINNPLTAILTNVQMILAFAEGDEVQADRESLQMIEEATQRCRTIVQKLMTYSKKPMESESVAVTDLAEVLQKTVEFIRYQLEQDGVQLVVKAESGCYPVMADHNELEQVLTNLILNARDATLAVKKSGTVEIELFKEGNQVKLTVKDEGVGMPEELITKIFDPFFTTKDVGEGLGLGLSICHSIVEKYQGKIIVESKEGKGTIFTLQFLECAKGKMAN